MSQWILLVNSDHTKAEAIKVLPRLLPDGVPQAFIAGQTSNEQAFSIRLYQEASNRLMKDASLNASAINGGSFGYKLLWDEKAITNEGGTPHFEASAYFELQNPTASVTGRSADLLFALVVITAALPRAGGYPHFAATGELDEPAGTVYPVNGIPAKFRAAIEKLQDLPEPKFIFYPIGNEKDVDETLKKEAEQHGIELCPLAWFDEALEKLGVPLELYLGNPFMGLQSFTRKQREVYFGRREEAKQLAQKLIKMENENKTAALAILAASGWGKSSFIQAGLLPELEDQLRFTDRPLNYCQWRFEIIRSATALETIDAPQLLEALRKLWLPEAWRKDLTETQQLAIDQANGFLVLAQAMANALPSGQRFLWAIDQAEELFTLGFSPKAIQSLVDFLRTLRNSGIWLLLALRNDFFKDYQKYLGEIMDNQPLRSLRTTLDSIIQEPVKRARRPPIQFESFEDKTTLANLLSKDMPHSPEDALPLLQFALSELWKKAEARRHAAMITDDSVDDNQNSELEKQRHQRKITCILTLEDYEALAGSEQSTNKHEPEKNRLERIIGKYADGIYQKLDSSVQAALSQLLWDLTVMRRDSEGVYRYYAQSAALANYPKDSEEAKLIASFAHENARLLILDEGKFRVVHEALLNYWDKARQELQALRDDMLIRDQVRHDLSLWEVADKPDDLLLKTGKRLTDAKNLLKERNKFLRKKDGEKLITYIEASITNENQKKCVGWE